MGGKGIEGELLTIAGDNWQIPDILVEITFDRPIIRKKKRAPWQKRNLPDNV